MFHRTKELCQERWAWTLWCLFNTMFLRLVSSKGWVELCLRMILRLCWRNMVAGPWARQLPCWQRRRSCQPVIQINSWQKGSTGKSGSVLGICKRTYTSMLPDITMILHIYIYNYIFIYIRYWYYYDITTIYAMLIVGCLKSGTFHLGGSTHHAPHRVHLRSIAGWPRCSLVTPMTGLKQGWNDVEVMTQKTQSNGGEGVCCGKAIQMNSKCWQWKQMFRGLLASYLILDLTIEVPDSPRMKTVEAPKNAKNW